MIAPNKTLADVYAYQNLLKQAPQVQVAKNTASNNDMGLGAIGSALMGGNSNSIDNTDLN